MEGRVCFCSESSLAPLPLLAVPLLSRNGRNFKRKFTNEGDFPRPPPRRFTGRRRRRGRRGGGEGCEEENRTALFRSRFPRALHHQRTVETFPPSFVSSFFLFPRGAVPHGRTTVAKNEIPRARSRQKFIPPIYTTHVPRRS